MIMHGVNMSTVCVSSHEEEEEEEIKTYIYIYMKCDKRNT